MGQSNNRTSVKSSGEKNISRSVPIFVKCPHCDEELMDSEVKIDFLPSIKLVAHVASQSGFLWLSAQYGSFQSISEMNVEVGQVTRISCPHCKHDLPIVRQCSICLAPMHQLYLFSGGSIEFCSRKGCSNHHLEFQDIDSLSDFYDMLHLDYSPAP